MSSYMLGIDIGTTSTKRFDPVREREVLDMIAEHNEGPFETSTVQHILKTIFKASLELQEDDNRKALLVSRKKKQENTIVDVKGELIGNGTQTFIMGPCAVESLEQVRQVGQAMKDQGLKLMRGGAFKPRTSPYDFQGLGVEGLQILRQVADEFDLAIISEILNPNDVEMALDYVDVIQVGADTALTKNNLIVTLRNDVFRCVNELINCCC